MSSDGTGLTQHETEAIFFSLGEGIAVIDEDGIVTKINRAALNMLKIKEEQAIGSWYGSVLIACDNNHKILNNLVRPETRSLISGMPISERLFYKTNDGSVVPVQVTASPLIIDGSPRGTVEVFRDISKELEIEKAKDEILNLISHQLRTPLTSIRWFSELLLKGYSGKLQKRQVHDLEIINESTIRMINLVGDILNISRVELGKVSIHPKKVNLNDIVEAIVHSLNHIANNSNVKVKLTKYRSNLYINIDSLIFENILQNLLTNAIRYVKPNKGRVEVKIYKNKETIIIEINDNGIGIPESDREKIFTRFFRSTNAKIHTGEGTGLGLYIAKTLCDLSGLEIKFISTKSVGSTFYVRIPKEGMISGGFDEENTIS